MEVIENLYLITSVALVVAGLTMAGVAIHAYLETSRKAMIHLAIGFVLIIAATLSTVISAFMTGFEGVRVLLLVNNGISTFGYLFVIFSLVTYE